MNIPIKRRAISFEIITGSSRANGNSEQVADHIAGLLALRDVRASLIRLREYQVHRCGSCGECNTREVACSINDDMPALISRMSAADAIIYVAPVHGYGLAQPMQTFIERAGVGYLRFSRPLANKVAGCVITGRRYGHISVFNQLINNILLNRMILAGSGYPTILLGGTPGKALEDQEGMQSVRNLVDRMVGMTNLLAMLPPSEVAACLASQTANERVFSAGET